MMKPTYKSLDGGSGRRATGAFSLLEVLVALAIFLIVLSIVFVFFVDYGKSLNSESSMLDTQMAARVALDELARSVQQLGYNIDRTAVSNPAVWQRDLIYAGAHVLAFNADIDTTRGPINSSVTLTFPTGETYTGEGPATTTTGAETYMYTIDANNDNSLTTADHTAAATGSYNPAADTENPLDYALFKKVYGYDGTDYGGGLTPISSGLFTNATSDAVYPSDSTTPNPLFRYWLTEDLDSNGLLDAGECVVGTCPPSTTRKPLLYLWGDTNFDGVLSESEKTALKTMPVSSPSWSKNFLQASGVYKSTTLTAAVDPSAAVAYVLTLTDASKMAVGAYVQIDTGGSTELNVVVGLSTTANTVDLAQSVSLVHAVGATVRILPQTLLRAVRAVQIDYDAITPKKDNEAGVASAGRIGHQGTKGLEYRVKTFEKTVEVVNMQTQPLIAANTNPKPTCPLTIAGSCGGSTISSIRAFVPVAGASAVPFQVKDASNNPVAGVPVGFSQSNSSIGSLVPAAGSTVKSNSSGIASASYTPNGPIGDSVVTATATCANSTNQLVNYTATVTVKATKAVISTSNDCLTTVSSKTSTSYTDFTVQVVDSGGAVTNSDVLVGLAFDPASLPSTPNYSKYQGELFISGVSQGLTDSNGYLAPVNANTSGTGTLSGRVALNRDTDGTGARLNIMVTPVGTGCATNGAAVTKGVTFYKLNVTSTAPSTSCTEASPCTIAAGALSPAVQANLMLKNLPVASAPVTFTKSDFHGSPDTPPAASTLVPSATATTDGSGNASVYIGNNGSSSITPGNPLQTKVDATSTGDSANCASGNIISFGLRPQFNFSGSTQVGICDSDIQQAWISGLKKDMCMHVQDPVSARACPMLPTGIKITVYQTDGVTPDPLFIINSIEGGTIDTTTSCSSSGKTPQLLFQKSCNANLAIANGQRWDFVDIAGKCSKPTNSAPAGSYFIFDKVTFQVNVAGLSPKRKMDVTIYFQCQGLCSGAGQSETFFGLLTP